MSEDVISIAFIDADSWCSSAYLVTSILEDVHDELSTLLGQVKRQVDADRDNPKLRAIETALIDAVNNTHAAIDRAQGLASELLDQVNPLTDEAAE